MEKFRPVCIYQTGMHLLVTGLNHLRQNANVSDWNQFTKEACLVHPIASLLHQDPFTHHSYSKPRGYAGDAELLDYIYGLRSIPNDTTPLGKKIFQFTSKAPAPRSVCARRDLLRVLINEVAGQPSPASILSVACGHLRELEDCASFMQGHVNEFLAFDQDDESLQVVQATKPVGVTKIVQGSVRSLLTGQLQFNNLDFVYAAGLYDYLTQPVARRLTQLMFEMLNPGGRLLVANFAPSLIDIGYMETFMQWKLIYRTPDEMAQLSEDIPYIDIATSRQFWDEHNNITFLEITKRS
jgi:extracellular factor (EF) 3-hydroxypalmitic acid methyl ester biosynthesis protein